VSVVANVAINVDSRNAVSKLRQVQTQSQQTERAVEGLSRAFGGLAAAFGAGFALTKVIADVKELDTNLRRLGTVGGNVAALDKGLGALSDRLDGVANKAELAAASYQALSAGFTETGANLRVVEAATKAAVGGLADITGVVDVTTKVLNSYNMSGDQAAKVTDSISKAVELGQVQWSDYTSQLGRVASIAAIAGVSLDEVNAFVAAATKNGATAEVAFTGLGASLATIIKPTKESAKAAQALGINWTLAGLRGEGFESLMNQLAKAMESNTEKATEMVGGQEAVRGAFAAASKGGKDYAMILEGLGGAAGKTDADFQTMKGSLENTLKALDTSFKNLSEALGTAFGPTVVIAVQDITKAVNGFADFMATVPQPVMDTTGELVKLIAQMILLKKAIDAIIGLRLAFIGAMTGMTGATAASGTAATASAGAFALYTNNARAMQAASIAATGSVSGLASALLGLAGIGIITVGVNYVVTQVGAISGNISSINASEAAGTSGGLAAQLKGKSAAERKKMMVAAQKNLANDQKLAQRLQLQLQAQEAASTDKPDPSQRTELLAAQARIKTNQARIRAIQSTPVTAATPAATAATAMGTPTTATGTGTGAKKGSDDAERAAEEAKRLAEQIREQTKAAESFKIQQQGSLAILRSSNDFEKAFVEFSVKRTEIQRRYSELTLASKSDEERKLLTEARALEFKQSSFELQKQIADLTKQATAPLDDIVSKLKDQVAFEREYGELIENGTNPELAKQIIEINRVYDASVAALVPALDAAQAAVTEAKARGASATEIQKYREELERIQAIQSGLPAKKTDAIGAATELTKPKTDQQNITEKIATLKKEITDLTSISNIAITSAEGIGNAFAQSFQGLIDGSMTAKEALGSFFKSVADMFLEMAAQIIAKQITMIILQTILKALGAVGGIQSAGSSAGSAAFGGSGPTFNPGAFSMPQLAGRAVGGPVTSQQPYMVGERGPELFVPGTGGSVVSNGDLRSAMNGGSGGANGSPVLNMSFQSTSINGVEYVSRDQLESAMAETRRNATRDGAKRGMTMTLDRIQNSSSTRRKVGI
jgi:TP901 family phage tail tape measure protein